MQSVKSAVLVILFLGMIACHSSRQGPAEEAGESIDRSVEEAGDAVEDLTDY